MWGLWICVLLGFVLVGTGVDGWTDVCTMGVTLGAGVVESCLGSIVGHGVGLLYLSMMSLSSVNACCFWGCSGTISFSLRV